MAKKWARQITKTIILTLTIVVSIGFLFTNLSPYLSPTAYPLMGFAALASPYFIPLLLLCIFFWLFAKPIFSLIPLVTLLIGYQQINVFFAFQLRAGFTQAKKKNHIRIINWNIQGFNGLTTNKNSKKLIRNEVAESIAKLNGDIVCLQEFNNSKNTNNIALFNEKYPYYFFSKDYTKNNGYSSGNIIFSKYPIIHSQKINYPKAESLIYVDIVIKNDTIRVYTTHLQSFKFKKDDYDNLEKITDQNEDAVMASKNIFRKMNPAFKRRATQADIIKSEMKKSLYRSIICGDFNDVPNSYTYFTIKGNKQDAFLKKDFGIGRTYIALAPTLRIDYILADPQFDIHQFDMVDEGLSDHIMLVTDLQLKSK